MDMLSTNRQPHIEQIVIKQEKLLTDEQPEIEQIYVKEENGLEIPEDHDGSDPLQEGQGECVSEEETSYPSDAPYIKQDPECMLEDTTTAPDPSHIKIEPGPEESSCGSDAESTVPIAMEDSRNVGLPTGTGDTIQCTTIKEASCRQNIGTQYLILTCTFCEKTFASLQALKEHNHTEFTYGCSLCHKKFTRKSRLKMHFRQHTDLHPEKCNVCHKTLKNGVALKIHLRKHTGERPYHCEWCPKAFISSTSLKLHARVHNGQRPDIVCQVCHKAFTKRSSLKRHTMQHTGERPYECGVCHKTFRQKCAIKKHVLLHVDKAP